MCVEVEKTSKIAFISETVRAAWRRSRVSGRRTALTPTPRPRPGPQLCIGCGICVKKCPFDAIQIINLPKVREGGTIAAAARTPRV